jgi:hypothetical protein
MMSGMPASSVSVCSAPETRASRSFSSSGAAVRGEQINDRIDQRARVEDARIDDVLQCRLRTSMSRTTCWRATLRRRPADDGAPEPASSTESIIEYVRTADAAMAARAQRRACGSLPSFGETRRGTRRHGDARLGAAKRVERDAKLRHRCLRHAHRIVDGERVVDVLQNTM